MTIKEIKEKYNVDQIWSWSKYKVFKDDKYMFYLKYVVKALADMPNSCYSTLGEDAHSIMEDFYNNEIKYEDMAPRFEEAIFKINMLGLKYDRTNKEKNHKIAKKYENSVRHFFKHHDKIPCKLASETYMLTFIGKYLFQGYIDASHNEDGTCVITDWKTSSIYTGQKLSKESPQLKIYAIALANKGIDPSKIKLRWNFMKYVDVQVQQKNGNSKDRTIIRCELGQNLAINAKMWLKDSGYTDERIEGYINNLVKSNEIDCLPEEIQEKYVIKDCYVYVDCNKKELDDLKNEICKELDKANRMIKEYEKSGDKNIWWQEVDDSYSYFMSNLSDFSAKIHLPYAKYLDNLKNKNDQLNELNNDDLFKELFS